MPQFKLPVLKDNNIFQADFFDPDSGWAMKRPDVKADWLVGNPPWKDAKAGVADDRYVLEWMRRRKETFPTGGNQVAEAFVWHSLPLLSESAVAGLLLPAMTLFKLESTAFRARLFKQVRAWCVANFANLAYVLFAGRSKSPAMALFFEPRAKSKTDPEPEERILTFTPFLANQRAGRTNPVRQGKETWSVVVNGAELRELPAEAATSGDFRPWKLAMWGSFRDDRLLRRTAHRFASLAHFSAQYNLRVHEGFQLRTAGSEEKTQPMPDLAGKMQVDFSKLKECGRIFAFPRQSLSSIPPDMAFVRVGRGELPLCVSEPPHIIIDAGRRFAVYSDEFIAVPAREIGIHGPESDLLKALSLYLSSDFSRYQQFFMTPQWGVGVSVATLKAFRSIPVSLGQLKDAEVSEWARLQEQLAAESSGGVVPSAESLHEVDERVYRLLGLTAAERILVDDFVHWNMQLVQGKVPRELVAPPSERALRSYLSALKRELDEFVEAGNGISHDVQAVRAEAGASAMIAIRLVRGAAASPSVTDAAEPAATALARTREHLLRRHSQWLYFERCLKIYQDGAMYVFKPLEMIHWTRRQAILDAGEIIAETIGSHIA
jgi:hypothetical protein